MYREDELARIVHALNEAMIDHSRWPGAVQVRRTADAMAERADTGFEIRFRSVPRNTPNGGSACEAPRPLLGTATPR